MNIVGEVSDSSDSFTYEDIASWSDEKLEEQLQALEEPNSTIEDLNNEIAEIRELSRIYFSFLTATRSYSKHARTPCTFISSGAL